MVGERGSVLVGAVFSGSRFGAEDEEGARESAGGVFFLADCCLRSRGEMDEDGCMLSSRRRGGEGGLICHFGVLGLGSASSSASEESSLSASSVLRGEGEVALRAGVSLGRVFLERSWRLGGEAGSGDFFVVSGAVFFLGRPQPRPGFDLGRPRGDIVVVCDVVLCSK